MLNPSTTLRVNFGKSSILIRGLFSISLWHSENISTALSLQPFLTPYNNDTFEALAKLSESVAPAKAGVHKSL